MGRSYVNVGRSYVLAGYNPLIKIVVAEKEWEDVGV